MKKIIALMVAVLIVVGVMPIVGASAAVSVSQKEQVFINAVLNGESSLSYSTHKMTYNELVTADTKLCYMHPEVWHYYNNATYDNATKKITINYKNGYTKSTIKQSLNEIESLTRPILNGVRSDWSDVEKALYLHDYICVNYKYDMELYDVRDNANFHMYELLTEGKGVCQSYAFLYKYLLDRVGIENYFVVTYEDDHSWNVVKINGKWHHVDVTYDDPSIALNSQVGVDYYGKAYHNYFLLSESELIKDGKHDGWFNPLGVTTNCVDYTGGELWKNADSAIVYEGGYWYYLDYQVGGLVRTRDFYSYTHLTLIEKQWYIYAGARYHTNYYSGIQAYNGRIFYTDSRAIYSYDIADNRVDKLANLTSWDNGSIFGFVMEGTTMRILLTDNIELEYRTGEFSFSTYVLCGDDDHGDFAFWWNHGAGRVYSCDLCGAVFDFSAEVAGDADGDSKVNVTDLAILKLAMAGTTYCTALADIDKNGIIDTSDLANLKLKLAGVTA